MKVEVVKEPVFSSRKGIKLIAENSSDEAILDDFFEEDLNMGQVDFLIDQPQSKAGFKDITIYKKK